MKVGDLVPVNSIDPNGHETTPPARYTEASLVKVADYETGVDMVRKGKVDALVADMPVCVLSALRYPEEGLMTLDQPITLEPVGIAVSAADPQFKNLIDTYIDAFEKTGMLTLLRQKWLEDGSWIAQLP